MPQKLNLSPEQLKEAREQQSAMADESIPALDGAKHYFAYINYQGTPVLCILDNGNWRPTTQQELINMLS